MKKTKGRWDLLLLSSALCLSAFGHAERRVSVSGAAYIDSREFATTSIAIAANSFANRVSIWGFTDFHGDQDSLDFRMTRSFSEYRLTLTPEALPSGLGMQAEHNASTGNGNGLARFGVTYRHGFLNNGWLQWRVFPYESDDNGGQISLVFGAPLYDRVQIKGFADYNVVENGLDQWVIEMEFNVQLRNQLSGLVELRYNGYEDTNAVLDGTGVAMGLRYAL